MRKIKFGFILLLTLMLGIIPAYATNTEVEIVESLEETKEEKLTDKKCHNLTINFNAKFEDETLMNKIKAIEITIPNGVKDSEGASHNEEIILLKNEGFSKNVSVDIYSDKALVRARVFNDTAYRYDIEFEGREKLVYYGEEIRNATEIDLIETTEIDLNLIVLKQGENKINDSNLVTETPEIFEKINKGEYGESREQEIKMTEKETQKKTEDNTEKTTTQSTENQRPSIIDSEVFGLIGIILGVILTVGIIVILVIRKRINEDDD